VIIQLLDACRPSGSGWRILSHGVSFPLLKVVMLTSRRIWSISPGCVNWIDLDWPSLEIWTPSKAETSPSSFNLNDFDRDAITLSTVDA
jgi:hypothetical protein